MQTKTEPAVVRQHERVQCELPAVVGVAPEMAERVVFAGTVCGSGRAGGTIGVSLIDCSKGGLGLRTKVFMPKHARLVVKVACGPSGEAQEFVVVAQRVRMLDRGPVYYVGASFAGEGAGTGSIDALMAAARSAPAPVAPASAAPGAVKEPARA